jgi:restriction system protein
MYHDLAKSFITFLGKTTKIKDTQQKTINPEPFVKAAKEKYGWPGVLMAIELIEGINDLHKSPWGSIRQIDWKDIAQLRDLFQSESLETLYGKFIDQRYIDFLSHNFDSIGDINWREFEALTCEYFERQGYYVEIGDGRDDDGIDASVWLKENEKSGPPTILIQCKRYRERLKKWW